MKLIQELLTTLHESHSFMSLTQDDKQKILDDIESWSGGLTPHEMDEEDIDNYIEHSLPAKYVPGLVRSWLNDFIKGGGSEDYVVTDIHHNPDDISVLVVAGDNHLQPASHNYYGVNVVFIRGGDIELVTNDKMADWQAENHREKIIAAAEKEIRKNTDSMEYFKELGYR
jgi:hypothetical protein